MIDIPQVTVLMFVKLYIYFYAQKFVGKFFSLTFETLSILPQNELRR